MPEFPETSHSLIARVKDLGDEAAWTEFLGIYQPVVFRDASNVPGTIDSFFLTSRASESQ